MRKWISFFCHLLLIAVMTSFATFSETSDNDLVEVPDSLLAINGTEVTWPANNNDENEVLSSSPVFLGKSYYGFKEALAFKESQGKYSAVNTLGYLGKYQFGGSTLRLMGLYDLSNFLNNAELQEKMFNLNVARNKWILRRDIKRFNGKKINGTIITESGIIAAAHLAGAGNVKKYLRSYGQEDVSDAYGSRISYYMRKFGGFDVSLINAEHNPKL